MRVILEKNLNVMTTEELIRRDWIAIKDSAGQKYMVIADDFNQCLLTEGRLVGSPRTCDGKQYLEHLDELGNELHTFEFRREMFDWMESDE